MGPAHHRGMSTPTAARQPAGTPAGGQFATVARTEPDLELEEADDELEEDDDELEEDERCSACGGDLSDNEGYDGLCGTCADAAEADGLWDDDIDED